MFVTTRHIFTAIATALLLCAMTGFAVAAGFSGQSGQVFPTKPAQPAPARPAVPQTAQPHPPTITITSPDVSQTGGIDGYELKPAVPVRTTGVPAPATPPAADNATIDTEKADQCAAYLGRFDLYTMCQDRLQKLDRMKQARERRTQQQEPARDAAEKTADKTDGAQTEEQPQKRRRESKFIRNNRNK